MAECFESAADAHFGGAFADVQFGGDFGEWAGGKVAEEDNFAFRWVELIDGLVQERFKGFVRGVSVLHEGGLFFAALTAGFGTPQIDGDVGGGAMQPAEGLGVVCEAGLGASEANENELGGFLGESLVLEAAARDGIDEVRVFADKFRELVVVHSMNRTTPMGKSHIKKKERVGTGEGPESKISNLRLGRLRWVRRCRGLPLIEEFSG